MPGETANRGHDGFRELQRLRAYLCCTGQAAAGGVRRQAAGRGTVAGGAGRRYRAVLPGARLLAGRRDAGALVPAAGVLFVNSANVENPFHPGARLLAGRCDAGALVLAAGDSREEP